jgi:hypothetical protein
MIGYQALVNSLPSPNRTPPLHASATFVSYVGAPITGFVPPQFTVQSPIQPGETSIVLVSAPGAVGKSTVAKQLAHDTGAPLWNLAGAQVGSGTFLGTVGHSYGYQLTPTIMHKVSSGDILFILDAIDESEMRSGPQNFSSFLDELCGIFSVPAPRPTCLILGRTDTIEWLSLYFDDQRTPFARIQLEFFDKVASISFLANRLDLKYAQRNSKPVHRQHYRAFEECVEKLFQSFCSMLAVGDNNPWEQTAVRGFLGYAPVLEAVADYLCVQNFQALLSELREYALRFGERGKQSPWGFLSTIIDNLLVREQQKLIDALQPDLSIIAQRHKWSNWSVLYTPEEQFDRVSGKAFRLDRFPAQIPNNVPEPIWQKYEEALQSFLPQHPLLGDVNAFANIVFRELIYARNLFSQREELREAVELALTNPDYLPTPLGGRFLMEYSRRRNVSISSHHFGFLYESITSQAQSDEEIAFYVLDDENTEYLVVHFFLGAKDRVGTTVLLQLEDTTIVLRTRISHSVFFVVQSKIMLGYRSSGFRLGPDVFIQARQIVFQPAELAVQAPQDGDVILFAETAHTPQGAPRLRVYGPGEFGVFWQSLEYPWIQYKYKGAGTAPNDSFLISAFHQFCRIMSWFRSHRYGGLTRHKDLIEKAAVGTNPGRQKILAALKREGVIVSDGVLYRVDLEKLNQLGINWGDIHGRRMNPRIADFLARIYAS